MDNPIIEVNDVSMRFRISEEPINSLKEAFTKKLSGKLKYNEFYALNHVSFSVRRGQILGIIGRNGAGKSTLLKLISGILKPSSGTIISRGNTVPMLELGAGFDLELTGRENILLNGAILGFNKDFLENKVPYIIDFAEIGDFIDMPLRNYSSGMMARLAFSIASLVEPEILIVDEILSVGDIDFQAKSFNKMKELMSNGTTVLFVTHDMAKIDELCDSILVLDKGEISFLGDIDEYRK